MTVLVRWPASCHLLLVGTVGLSGWQQSLVRHTLLIWNRALSDRLVLTPVAQAPSALLMIRGEMPVGLCPQRDIAGVCDRSLSQDGRWLVGATIYLDPALLSGRGQPGWMTQARWQRTLLHEVGHALGLEHSQSPADLMYFNDLPTLWTAHQPGPGDLHQLALRYS